MANVNIVIADVFGLSEAGKFKAEMIKQATALYKKGIDAANKGRKDPHQFSVTVAVAAKPTVGTLDFIIHLLPIEMSSIVRAKNSLVGQSNMLVDHWGFTMSRGLPNGPFSAECELLHKSNDGIALGSLVIHELLHYKTLRGNDMHADGGLAAATVTAASEMNSKNIEAIATTLTRPITPWVDGWDVCASHKKRKVGGDDLWYL